jgi:hypothetical protein
MENNVLNGTKQGQRKIVKGTIIALTGHFAFTDRNVSTPPALYATRTLIVFKRANGSLAEGAQLRRRATASRLNGPVSIPAKGKRCFSLPHSVRSCGLFRCGQSGRNAKLTIRSPIRLHRVAVMRQKGSCTVSPSAREGSVSPTQEERSLAVQCHHDFTPSPSPSPSSQLTKATSCGHLPISS